VRPGGGRYAGMGMSGKECGLAAGSTLEWEVSWEDMWLGGGRYVGIGRLGAAYDVSRMIGWRRLHAGNYF